MKSIEQAAKDLGVMDDAVKQQLESKSNASSRPIIAGKTSKSLIASRKSAAKKSEPSKKRVSFESGVLDVPIPKHSDSSNQPPVKKKEIESSRKRASFVGGVHDDLAPGEAAYHKVKEQDLLNEISDREADEYERLTMAQSVIPEDESPEDAALRRQMIQYNMEEIGAVVAEIDLGSDTHSASESDSEILLENIDDDDDDEEVDEQEDEQEDEFGRTFKQQPLDEAYVKRMQALSNRLKAEPMINMGPEPSINAKGSVPNHNPETNETKTSRTPTEKKGVRFAKELDIQEAPEVSVASLLAASSAMTGTPIATPSSLKRTASAEVPSPIEKSDLGTEKKMSKFKAARAQAANNASIAKTMNPSNLPTKTSLTPPRSRNPNKILADTLVERSFPTHLAAEEEEAATSPSLSAALANEQADDGNLNLDLNGSSPSSLNNQISTEYHRLRTRQIQREGGFVRNTDDDGGQNTGEELLAEEEGGPKRMSRFKAARLGLR